MNPTLLAVLSVVALVAVLAVGLWLVLDMRRMIAQEPQQLDTFDACAQCRGSGMIPNADFSSLVHCPRCSGVGASLVRVQR